MPLIEVNLNAVREEVLRTVPGRRDIKKALKAIGAAARAEWISLASDELKTTARDYIQGIGEPKLGEKNVTITLTGTLPNMVEQGWPETDLRETVLTSPRAKKSKSGAKYMAIPFRHGTPGSGGSNVGLPMPKPIHNVAKTLQATVTARIGPSQVRKIQGTRLSVNTPGVRKPARAILESKMREWHSTSIYTGMIRKVAFYSRMQGGTPVSQSSYSTFRTISSAVKKDPRSWLHPGIKERDLASKVRKFVKKVAAQIMNDAAG